MSSTDVAMIQRQTDYTAEVASQKLQEHQNDVMAVIREYMAPAAKDLKKGTTPKISVNQQIYKEIRGMMDDAARNYELKKNT